MGLPLWRPKRDLEEERERREEELIKHQEDTEDEDSWSIFPHQIVHSVYNRRPSSRHFVNNNIDIQNINNTIRSNRHLSPVSSSIPLAEAAAAVAAANSSSSSIRRSRIARRHSMLTSSLMDRRRSSRVHQLPGTTSSSGSSSSASSPPMRSELDRRLQQRITEKEDLLEQLQTTVSLLDRFLSARTTLGEDMMTLPSFLTEDLPAVLESAASLAASAPSVLSSNSSASQHNSSNEVTTLHEMVDRLLQIPPYSIRIHNVETSIISTHRRIREQLGLLSNNSTIPLPPPITRPTPSSSSSASTTATALQQSLVENNNARPSFLNFLGP